MELADWPRGSHAPKNNAHRCSKEIEELIIHLVKQDFKASYNLTAKHAANITGMKLSANLVKGVRLRNGLQKPVEIKRRYQRITSIYNNVISVDVVRERGEHIFGFIQDRTKLVFHYHAKEQTAKEALNGLKRYIKLYGKPQAVRFDNGSEFRDVFSKYLKEQKIGRLNPLPYNPRANGFIERYFRTLRQHLFKELRVAGQKIDQTTLDDFATLWNHFRTKGGSGKTPGELAGVLCTTEQLNHFKLEPEQVAGWNFWHVQGIHGLLHAYLRVDQLPERGENRRLKIA